jgi:hypothetical protein
VQLALKAHSLSEEDIKRSLAADLLRADITGLARGRKRLRGAEAKELASAMLARLGGKEIFVSNADLVASWLGLEIGRRSVATRGMGSYVPKKITVQRYRVHGDGYDSPVDEDEEGEDANLVDEVEIRESFDVEWTAQFGALSGRFVIRGLVLGDGAAGGSAVPQRTERARTSDVRTGGMAASTDDTNEGGWRARFEEMERRLEESQEEVQRLREKILEAVL